MFYVNESRMREIFSIWIGWRVWARGAAPWYGLWNGMREKKNEIRADEHNNNNNYYMNGNV